MPIEHGPMWRTFIYPQNVRVRLGRFWTQQDNDPNSVPSRFSLQIEMRIQAAVVLWTNSHGMSNWGKNINRKNRELVIHMKTLAEVKIHKDLLEHIIRIHDSKLSTLTRYIMKENYSPNVDKRLCGVVFTMKLIMKWTILH